MRRVMVMYDGFNFYYGLKKLNRETGICLYWQDLNALSASMLELRGDHQANDILVGSEYFTADIRSSDHRRRWRQQNYFMMLNAQGRTRIVKGEYRIRNLRCPACGADPAVCRECGRPMKKHQEKKTDVNLALAAVFAALHDRFDDLILVTSDSDLTQVAVQVRGHFPAKHVYICFPPRQVQLVELRQAGDGYFAITREMLEACLLPRRVRFDGRSFSCPLEWQRGWAPR